MNKTQYLHISFDLKNDPVDLEKLKQRFNLGVDWIHYMPNCWIVKTTSSAQKWYDRLKPYIGNNNIFICKIDLSERQGWLPKWVWEWIKKHKDNGR